MFFYIHDHDPKAFKLISAHQACKKNEAQEIETVKKFEHIFTQINNFEKALEKFARENNRDVVTRDSVARCSIAAVGDDITK